MPLFGKDGERIGYAVYDGPAGAPPLLLVHGLTASSSSFFSNIPGLRERFRVIAVELLGHGASDAPPDAAPYAPEPAMERIAALLDQLEVDRVLVCGHSLGGALALRFALDHPQRLAGLVVINSNSAAGTPEWRDGARAAMAGMAAKARAEGLAFLRESRLNPGKGTRLPEEARRRLQDDFDQLSAEGFAGTAERLVVEVNAFERLGELQCPTLVVIGDKDTDFVRNAPRFLVRLPHHLVEVFTIEGAGHAANLEQPELFNDAVIRFAESIGYLPPPAGPVPLSGAEKTAEIASADGDVLEMSLGPTLYDDGIAWLRGRGRGPVVAVAGTALILAGAALVVASFVVGGDGDGGEGIDTAAVEATQTAGRVDQAAGVRTAAATPTMTATVQPTAAESPTPTAVPPTPQPAAQPVATLPAQPTPAPPAPAPTPTVEPTPVPTQAPGPTPSGPFILINGPPSGAVGEALTFVASENPQALTRNWSASNGAVAAHSIPFTVTFSTPGCHTVSLTAIFEGGATRTASRVVAIGAADCQ